MGMLRGISPFANETDVSSKILLALNESISLEIND